MTRTLKRTWLVLAIFAGQICLGNTAHAQFLKDLKGTIQRSIKDEVDRKKNEVHGKVEEETRSTTRCVLGESGECPELMTQEPETAQGTAIEALENCTPVKFQTEHPMMTDFTIQHEVKGMQNGRCIYEQSMPSNMKMICSFTEAGRMEAAAALRQAEETGRYQGSAQDTPGFARECEIEMANGYRMPAAGLSDGH